MTQEQFQTRPVEQTQAMEFNLAFKPGVHEISQTEMQAMVPDFFTQPEGVVGATPKTDAEIQALSSQDAITDLDQLPIIKLDSPQDEYMTFRNPDGFQVPVDRIIAANGFGIDDKPSWAGRAGGLEYTGGERSVDKIVRYAQKGKYEHGKTLEEKIAIDAYFTPEGEVFFMADGGNHRISAAKLRGDHTVTVKDINVYRPEVSTLTAEQTDAIYVRGQESSTSHEPEPELDSQRLQAGLEALGWQGLDVNARFDKVANMTPEEFVRQATLIHELVAPNTRNTPTDFPMKLFSPITGENKKTFVNPPDRFAVMDKGVDLVHKLAIMDDGTEEARSGILKRAANVLALTLAEVHPFEDGNGRTLRTLAHAIRFGIDSQENRDDLSIASANRPSEGFRINSFLPKDDLDFDTSVKAAASLDVPLADTETYTKRANASFTSPYDQ